jgi:hypothetical protein
MKSSELLFEKIFNDQPLFKSQLDLIQQLLTTPPYLRMYSEADEGGYSKALNRLKAYVSQLLSGNVSRKITDEFRIGLKVALARKIKDQKILDDTYIEIIEALRSVSQVGQKSNTRIGHFQNDLLQARYIAIIATRPFEAYDQMLNGEEKALINIFKADISEALTRNQVPSRIYRFNFPMQNHCELFWKNLGKLINIEMNKLAIATGSADESVKFLYSERIIRTYHVEDPIFSLPMVAINPDGSSTARLYTVVETENMGVSFLKISKDDMYPWKTFVWDKIKVSKHANDIPPLTQH